MSSDAPEPTDPHETSAAQTGSNVSTAIANAYLNNTNQVTPDGTLTYDKTGSYSYTDPYTGSSYTIPTFTATQTLSDQQQAIKDQSDQAELNLASLANNQSAFLNDYMATPFEYNTGDYEAWAGDLYNQLNQDQISQDTEALSSRLASQGIQPGSDAYNQAMGQLQTSQSNSRNQFMLDAYNTGMNTALTERNQPINEITALLSGSQVSQPNFVSTNTTTIPTTDNASIISNYDSQNLQAYQQSQSGLGSLIGGVGGLFTGASSLYTALSDKRAKTDIHKLGETDEGLGLYTFHYKGDDEPQFGLMAQEVQKKKPEAVSKRPDGFLQVDYEKALK